MTATNVATPTTSPAPPRPALSVPLPWLGTVELSRAQLVYVGGIAGLTVAGLLEWPIALVIAGGSVLTSDPGSRTGRDVGGAMAV